MMLHHPPGLTFQHINCAVGAVLHVPHGFQLSVGTINTRGFAHLPVGTTGKQSSTYSFAGVPLGASRGRLVPCGRDAILTINASVDLNAPASSQSSASIAIESVEVTITWRAC